MSELLIHPTLILIYDTILYIASAFTLFFAGKIFYDVTHKSFNVKEELVEKDNLAFAFSNVGYYVGILLVVGSALSGESLGIWTDLTLILIYGFLAILLLNLGAIINDKLVLRQFSMRKEIIEDRNVGTGVIDAANYIASGLIIFGAVSGEGLNFFPDMMYGLVISGMTSAVIFWLIGQLILVLAAYAYNIITPYDIHEHIEKDNIAVGIGYAGAIIAIANLIREGVGGDFISWGDHFSQIGIETIIGLLLLPIMRFVTDKVLLPGAKLTDELVNQEKPNVGAALIEAFAYIGGSVIIAWCI